MKKGKYQLGEVLGKGAMGTVYRATDQETGQVVAVKVLCASACRTPVVVQRFKKEYTAASRLRHPNIVRVLGVGEEGGVPFLVMELVRGASLGRHVARDGPLAVEDGLDLARQLASALDLAHQHHLIHRDVKPENVLIDEDGQAKLTDLGLVKDLASDDALTKTGTWLGTIAYMAPEQFGEAHHVDATCDVYGLAATLYFALTGVAPFHGGNMGVLGKKLKGDFRPPSGLARDLPKAFDEVFAAALHSEPSRRPSSCGELVARLRAAGPGPAEPDLPTPAAAERRVAFRYPTRHSAACRALKAGQQRWAGEVVDVSLTGVQLILDRRFERGSVLQITVSARDDGTEVTFLIRTAWSRELPDGRWALGCSFSHTLGEDDLAVFLGEKPGTVEIAPKA